MRPDHLCICGGGVVCRIPPDTEAGLETTPLEGSEHAEIAPDENGSSSHTSANCR